MPGGDIEFFVREKRNEMLEERSVAYEFERPSVYAFDPCERVVFLALAWRTDICFYQVTVAESIGFYLLGGEEDIVGRWKIVEIGGTEVAEAFGRNVKDSCCLEDSVEVVLLLELLVLTVLFIFLSTFAPLYRSG